MRLPWTKESLALAMVAAVTRQRIGRPALGWVAFQSMPTHEASVAAIWLVESGG